MDVGLFKVDMKWILIFITSCLLMLFLNYSFKVYSFWRNRGVPYMKPVLLFGNLSYIMRKSASDFFDNLRTQYPLKYVGIFLGCQPALVVQTPELARDVLVKDSDHFEDRYIYSNSSDPLGSLNLFVVKNPIWTEMRHQISPMFTSARLRLLTQLMNFNSKELVQKIKRDYADKNEVADLKELFTMYTSDTVGYTVFGLRVSALSGQDSPLWTISRHIVKWTFWRGLEFTLIFFLPFIAKILRLKFFSGAATDYIKQLFWNIAKERESTKTSSDKDLVNHLLHLKDNMKLPAGSDSELANNLMLAQAAVFILGSIETSSSTLTYCLHELSYCPEAQEKLYNEVNDALTRTGKEILEYDDLMELKYLSACLYETLRKHPPVPYLDRVCAKPYEIDGVKIEPGLPVFVNVVAIHRDSKIYPEPDRWDPSRPCPTSDNDSMNHTFLPFGEGPRFCIGKRYGMMQMRTALAQIIHKYRLEPGSSYELASDPYSVLQSPKNGGPVKFITRQSSKKLY